MQTHTLWPSWSSPMGQETVELPGGKKRATGVRECARRTRVKEEEGGGVGGEEEE